MKMVIAIILASIVLAGATRDLLDAVAVASSEANTKYGWPCSAKANTHTYTSASGPGSYASATASAFAKVCGCKASAFSDSTAAVDKYCNEAAADAYSKAVAKNAFVTVADAFNYAVAKGVSFIIHFIHQILYVGFSILGRFSLSSQQKYYVHKRVFFKLSSAFSF
eukprot:TRINITY_DN55_c1_g3_i1.p1 TRINITY_DN55_c1_g3~~TRINITY_DN55_c1_g3_i1.p1  ORF type:complete len:166 (-),score=13.09 TRINITY_DN55_c1_g3_i1:170-667(-)